MIKSDYRKKEEEEDVGNVNPGIFIWKKGGKLQGTRDIIIKCWIWIYCGVPIAIGVGINRKEKDVPKKRVLKSFRRSGIYLV